MASEQNKKENSIKYYDLKVEQVIHETSDAITIVFAHPSGEKIDYKPGQFLTLIANIHGSEVRRAYSLCTAPSVDPLPAVTVKKVDNGLMSDWLYTNLKAGNILRVMSPLGSFTTAFDPKNKRHLVLFAGGSGITPIMSLIKSALVKEPDSIVSLIYCNRNIDSIIFKEQFDELQNKNEGRLQVVHVLDEAPLNWQGYSGLLNPEMLKSLLERIPNWGVDQTSYWMCGPEGMMKNVESLLSSRAIPSDKIHKESFVQKTIDKATPAETVDADENIKKERVVTIQYDGEVFKVKVPPGQPILETALDQGIDLPFSCQSGLCTACRGKALSGKVRLADQEALSQSELDEGYVLTCVGYPMSDDVVIEIG